jgi:hypothetical protein
VVVKGFAAPELQRRWHSGRPAPGERGTALTALLILLVLVSCALMLDRSLHRPSSRWVDEAVAVRTLSDARNALIAGAATLSPALGRDLTPGLLPFPDRNRDGNYDGKGDCVTFGLNDSHLLGRLPWAGDTTPCPRLQLGVDFRDGGGQGLWYAVSRNLLIRGRGGPVNPRLGDAGHAAYPWIRLRNGSGALLREAATGEPLAIAAVVIAPGAALASQDRSGRAPGPGEYLDSVSIGPIRIDNADTDGCPDGTVSPCTFPSWGEEFISHPEATDRNLFNDRLTYIAVDELIRAVERRVLGEVAIALDRYRDAFGAYPWLASFGDPTDASFAGNLERRGFLPVHLPGGAFTTRLGASWGFVDATPTTVRAGDARLAPPLPDLTSGSVQFARASSSCVWSDQTRGDCEGSSVDPAYYRADLGVTVRRTVEVAFQVVDPAPRVISPTSSDARRRTLSVTSEALPVSTSMSWNVRITDDDGVQQGRRELTVDADTRGTITLSGIRYDLSVVYDGIDDARDELPEWFVENDWHHFIHAAFSADAVAGGNGDGDDDCRTPVDDCLTLMAAGRPVPRGVRALLISSSAALSHQDRSIGDCNGDGIADDHLCAWLEGDNSDRSTPVRADTYVRGEYSRQFNDQVRVIDPSP